MLADRVRMGNKTGDGDGMVNITINDTSIYSSPMDSIGIRPIVEGFELTPSDFDTLGYVPRSRLNEIISLYCGHPIMLPRNSTINVTTLNSKYFIITMDGFDVISSAIHLINRDVTVEQLSPKNEFYSVFRLSKNLKDGDIIDLTIEFD